MGGPFPIEPGVSMLSTEFGTYSGGKIEFYLCRMAIKIETSMIMGL
jgi:hypothetical protein